MLNYARIRSLSVFFLFFFLIYMVLIIIGFQVYGPSMLPTLNLSGDVLLVEQLSHRLGKVCLGDVVHRCGIFFNFMSVVV